MTAPDLKDLRLTCALSFCALLLCLPAHPAMPDQMTFSTPQAFAAHLHRLSQSLDKPDQQRPAIVALPDDWRVQTPDGTYTVSTNPLRTSKTPKIWLDNLTAQIDQYGRSPRIPDAAQPALHSILAQPEFDIKERPPSQWDLLKRNIGLWLTDQVGRLFEFAARNPAASKSLFWFLILAALGFIALVLLRWWQASSYRLNLSGAPPPSAAQHPWNHWLDEARKAAVSGDLRLAIQLAYWGAIAKLQQANTLPSATAHTPREYLFLLTPGDSAKEPLRTLTTQMERFWYAGASPTPDDFDRTLTALQEIGCRLA